MTSRRFFTHFPGKVRNDRSVGRHSAARLVAGLTLSLGSIIPWFLVEAAAAAGLPDSPRVQPYLHVEAPPVYDMGVIDSLGATWWDAGSKLDLLVAANFHHGGVSLLMSDLKHTETDATIGKERIWVRQLHTDMYLSMNDPVTVSGPLAPGVYNLMLDFRVRPSFSFAPGKYNGILTITVTGP